MNFGISDSLDALVGALECVLLPLELEKWAVEVKRFKLEPFTGRSGEPKKKGDGERAAIALARRFCELNLCVDPLGDLCELLLVFRMAHTAGLRDRHKPCLGFFEILGLDGGKRVGAGLLQRLAGAFPVAVGAASVVHEQVAGFIQ